ncbi:DUF418 domain-containing protein [Streptomyces sp. NPDC002122]|uniref:DUF418 domain-containing protein n=1 Tax=Streptomyces sp. NPDC002122 TaxID=3154407 RepID=UPI00332F35BC
MTTTTDTATVLRLAVGRVAPPGVLATALALFAVQAVGARWWLRRYRYGPLEWLLRAWTTLTLPPLRRS